MPTAIKVNDFVFTNLRTMQELQNLKDELAKPEYAGLSDEDALKALVARPLVANPVAANQIPDPAKVNVGNLLGLLSRDDNDQPTAAMIVKIPDDSLNRVGDHIKALEIQDLIYTCSIWEAKGYITKAKKDALMAEITATIPDPRHKSQILGDSKLTLALGREAGGLSIKEVAEARKL